MQPHVVVERLLVGELPPAAGVVAGESVLEVGRANVSVQVARVVVASVTAGVGASVGVVLVVVPVLTCDMFIEVNRQHELGAADLALVHSSMVETFKI